MLDVTLMLQVKLPVDRNPQSNKFAAGVENKGIRDSKLKDCSACFLFILEKNSDEKKKKNNLFTSIIKMYILFVHAIITINSLCYLCVFIKL